MSILYSPALLIVNFKGTTEMLLLLLWRHLTYYSEGRHINNAELKTSASHAMRFLSSPDADTFSSEVGTRLAPVLQRLSSLELVRLHYLPMSCSC